MAYIDDLMATMQGEDKSAPSEYELYATQLGLPVYGVNTPFPGSDTTATTLNSTVNTQLIPQQMLSTSPTGQPTIDGWWASGLNGTPVWVPGAYPGSSPTAPSGNLSTVANLENLYQETGLTPLMSGQLLSQANAIPTGTPTVTVPTQTRTASMGGTSSISQQDLLASMQGQFQNFMNWWTGQYGWEPGASMIDTTNTAVRDPVTGQPLGGPVDLGQIYSQFGIPTPWVGSSGTAFLPGFGFLGQGFSPSLMQQYPGQFIAGLQATQLQNGIWPAGPISPFMPLQAGLEHGLVIRPGDVYGGQYSPGQLAGATGQLPGGHQGPVPSFQYPGGTWGPLVPLPGGGFGFPGMTPSNPFLPGGGTTPPPGGSQPGGGTQPGGVLPPPGGVQAPGPGTGFPTLPGGGTGQNPFPSGGLGAPMGPTPFAPGVGSGAGGPDDFLAYGGADINMLRDVFGAGGMPTDPAAAWRLAALFGNEDRDLGPLRSVWSQQGMPIDQTPAWQAMIDAQQRNLDRRFADLTESFNVSGNRFSTAFGNAATDYWTQAGKDQNALLAQMTLAAQEAARQRQYGAAGQLGQLGFNTLAQLRSQAFDAQEQARQRQLTAASQLGQMGYGGVSQLSQQGFGSAMEQMRQQFGAASQLYGGSNQAAQMMAQLGAQGAMALLGGSMQGAQGMFGAENQAALAEIQRQMQLQQMGLGTAFDLSNLWRQNLDMGSQLGMQQYEMMQDQIDRMYQEYMRTQPYNNPMLPYIFSSATGYPPMFFPQYQPSQIPSFMSAMGGILGGLGAFRR